VGGIPEIIADGESGLLVSPDAPQALAEAMRALAADAARREAMGEAAFRRVAQSFSIRRHAERVMEVYDAVLRASAGGRRASGP
jgi:glycosyltransferase involved in cell wall biosynthesis